MGLEKNYDAFHAMGVDIVADVIDSLLRQDQGKTQLDAKNTPSVPKTKDSDNGAVLVFPPSPPRAGVSSGGESSTLENGWPTQATTSTPSGAGVSSSGAVDVTGLRSLEVGLKRLALSAAVTNMGLPASWVKKLLACHDGRSQVLTLTQLLHGTSSGELLMEGDLLLAVDGQPVCTFRDVESCVGSKPAVALTLLRDEQVLELSAVPTAQLDGVGTDRILVWAGLVLQAPYRATREMGEAASQVDTFRIYMLRLRIREYLPALFENMCDILSIHQVYCSYYLAGSPASFYGLKSCRFLTHVGSEAVNTLGDLCRAVKGLEDGAAVRLRMVDLQGQASSFTLKVGPAEHSPRAPLGR